MKPTFFSWSVGKAILTSSPDFAKAYLPSPSDFERFVEDTKILKSLVLSRDVINKELSMSNLSSRAKALPVIPTPRI